MSLFQKPPITADEVESQAARDRPGRVLELDEAERYACVYRRDSPQLTFRAVLMGTVLGFFLSFTNVYIGLKTGWFLGINLAALSMSSAV